MHPASLSEEILLRKKKIASLLKNKNIDAILIGDNANLFYTSGRVFNGYTYITKEGQLYFFVKRPVALKGSNVIYIHKPEQITEELIHIGLSEPISLALEVDQKSYSEIIRLSSIFSNSKIENGSAILRESRSVKTPYEIEQLKASGIHHEMAYSKIKKIYHEGMTDLELQIELERVFRLEGSLGQFRVSGQSMEIFMGNILCGDNADAPTPYDFAMGGGGVSPSLPVGCNGTTIKPGMTVMVDMGGNFNGYMTDMTRVFYVGTLNELAKRAHELSIEIHEEIKKIAKPGIATALLYQKAVEMAKEANLETYFMGHRQKASFIGHGVGIEINEMPVLAPRSKDLLQEGNVIAIEPKFVIPHVGAVGIENTYVVTKEGLDCITNSPEEILELY